MFGFSTFTAHSRRVAALGAFAIGAIAWSNSAEATPVQLFPFLPMPPAHFAQPQAVPQVPTTPQAQAAPSDDGTAYEMPARLRG
jgi:hypothetical protein